MCGFFDEEDPNLRNLGKKIARENSRGIKKEKGEKIKFDTNFIPPKDYHFCSSLTNNKEDTKISSSNSVDEQHLRVMM